MSLPKKNIKKNAIRTIGHSIFFFAAFAIVACAQRMEGDTLRVFLLLIYKCRVSVPNNQLGLNPLIV